MKALSRNLVTYMIFLLFSFKALADANEASMQVTATVEPSCTITASNLNFGPYNFAISNETATIAVLCTNGTKFKLGLNSGSTSGSSISNRMMANNNNFLKYSLYQDPGMRVMWGSDSSNSMSGNGTGAIQYFKIYGRIPENQNLPVGLYRDNILISLIIDGLSGFGYQLSVGMNVAATIRP